MRGPYHYIFYVEMKIAALNAMSYDAWILGNVGKNNRYIGRVDLIFEKKKDCWVLVFHLLKKCKSYFENSQAIAVVKCKKGNTIVDKVIRLFNPA